MDIEAIRKSAFAVPIFATKDIQKSFAYYVEVLLFEKRWEWGDPADFGCVALGNAEIFLCQEGQGHPETWISLFIDHIDDYYQAIKQRGADIVMELRDEPWRMRETHVRDPDGHILRIGTSFERLAID